LGATLQKRLLNVFHYALKNHGFLILGSAETASSQPDLFLLADKKHRLYRKRMVDGSSAFQFPVDFGRTRRDKPPHQTAEVASIDNYRTEANRIILDRFAPPGVIVDTDLQILQFRGQTGPYLEP